MIPSFLSSSSGYLEVAGDALVQEGQVLLLQLRALVLEPNLTNKNNA